MATTLIPGTVPAPAPSSLFTTDSGDAVAVSYEFGEIKLTGWQHHDGSKSTHADLHRITGAEVQDLYADDPDMRQVVSVELTDEGGSEVCGYLSHEVALRLRDQLNALDL